MSSFRSKSDRKSCRDQSKSIKFVTSCAGHFEVVFSNTFVIVSLKLVIWCFNLPLRKSMLSCLVFSSSLYFSIIFLISSHYSLHHHILDFLGFPQAYAFLPWCLLPTKPFLSPLPWEPWMLLSCLPRPRSSRMGKFSPSSCAMRLSKLLPAISVISCQLTNVRAGRWGFLDVRSNWCNPCSDKVVAQIDQHIIQVNN